MIKYLRLLLFPFAIIYGLVVIIRNKLYDWKVLHSETFALPVICVGNLVVGGSGKTPVTEYLVRLLPAYKIAILSRGYGRQTKGFILADENATSTTIGDEPMQYYRKFKHVTVAVCEDRITGIKQLEKEHDLIILDDAFQHRKVNAGLKILLFEYRSLFRTQYLLPSGNLREPFFGYKRADALLITKAPDTVTEMQAQLVKRNFKPAYPAFFSSIAYGSLKSLNDGSEGHINSDTHVFMLTGIANPIPMLTHIKQQSAHIKHYDFPDHYQFKTKDVVDLITTFNLIKDTNKIIVTTEKDAQRLLTVELNKLLVNLPVYILPIEINVHQEGKSAFDKIVRTYVASTARNR